jgi:hypothetical protein
MSAPFRANPRPDSEVVALIERTLVAARLGRIKTIHIAAVDPLNETELLVAGDLSPVKSTVMLGALVRSIQELATRK